MRTAFINTLTELAKKDKRIYLLTGDLGFNVLENFIIKFPERFINCGVAEQNMMGVAAGLALSGKKPYVYSIIPFVIFRCFEQIRNDICYQNLDVKIIGVGAGFSYGPLGATHHAIEDIGTLRALPNITILSPGDPIETKQLILKSYLTKNPTYLRLTRGGEKIIHDENANIKIGTPFTLKKGKDGALIVNGVFLGIGKNLVEKLEKMGYNFKLISMPTLKPIDKKALFDGIKGEKLIFTLEEHNIIGGLGSVISEILLESSYDGLFKRMGIPDQYPHEVGGADYLRRKFALSEDRIIKDILKNYEKVK